MPTKNRATRPAQPAKPVAKERLSEPIHIRLTESLSAKLEERCAATGTSPSAMVRLILANELTSGAANDASVKEGVRKGIDFVKRRLNQIATDLEQELARAPKGN